MARGFDWDTGVENPYKQAPDHAFWSRAVSDRTGEAVEPVVKAGFDISPSDRIAAAGSCFAQHIAGALRHEGYRSMIKEPGDPGRQFGVYPARFGNIYTARQLLQLLQRAFGLFAPLEGAWRRADGFIDPFRPQVEPDGFATLDALEADRRTHMQAVRTMFEAADVFIFTLGLTEAWISTRDGATFPLAPGVAGAPANADHIRPHNLTVAEVAEDLHAFIELARVLNPTLKIMLTVSPVPLVATFTGQHVLAANTYSKSVLRVAAGMAAETFSLVDYFPSYEIVTGAQNGHRFWGEDLRSVTPQGVAVVMKEFKRAYLGVAQSVSTIPKPPPAPNLRAEHEALTGVICDEEANEG